VVIDSGTTCHVFRSHASLVLACLLAELPRPVPGDTGDAQLEMVRSLKKLLGTQFHALAAQVCGRVGGLHTG
jgi:hypothetical protein